ncbi:MAG: hypothetical protein JWO58_2429 [Chitinophagaceae bacterium]|nr:hypothetical protein [Chitinophagaceae bacterium]
MKTVIPLFLFVLLSFHVQAQLTNDDLYWTTTQLKKQNLYAGFQNKGYALLKGTFLYNSTAVTNDFVTQEIYRQQIPSYEEAQPSVDRLKNHNTLGLDVNASASGGFRLPSDTSLMFDVGVAYRDFSYLYFTRDLFKLAFQDYTQYVDKDAQIGESNMREYNYASVFVGMQKALSKNFLIGARASLIKGGFYQEVNIEQGAIHLSQGALFMPPTATITAPFQYYSQDRQANPFSADNGWGAGLDVFTQLHFNSAVFSLGVKDIGFINWKNMDAYIGDQTPYTYNGYDIIDLLRPGNTGGDPSPDDVAKQLGIPKQKVNKRTALPTKIQLGYLQKFSNHIALKADANYMFLPGYMPYGKLAVFFSVGNAFFITPAIVAGGFGKINSQLGIGFTAGTWSLQLNAMALEYLVMRSNYAGHGVDLFIAKSF